MCKNTAIPVSISIIIPTLNAGTQFASLLDHLEKQTIRPTQIIIADSGSTDKTLQIAAAKNCKIISIHPSEFDHGTTRNQAASEVVTEYLLFLTQDVLPIDDFLIDKLIHPMRADENIALSYGRQIPFPNASPLEQFLRQFNYPKLSVRKTRSDIPTKGTRTFFCSNSCMAIRNSVFRKLGGFKNNVITNEDMLFAATAILKGYSAHYSADAKVYHSHRDSLWKTWKRYYAIGLFFAENRWILEHVTLNGYTAEMLKSGIHHFLKTKKYFTLVIFIFQLVSKAIALKLGYYPRRFQHVIKN